MSQSQRILSGSQTKGSTATPSGSIIYSYQGINARTTESYFGSLLPRIGSGDRTAVYKNNKRLPEKIFDDTLTMNSNPADIRGEGDDPLQVRINFQYENRSLGQLDQRPEGYEWVETIEYDPVAYLQDQSQTMWPVNLFNSDMVPKYEFDGVIEPFDIRNEILGIYDTRYEGHAVRGGVVGGYSEGPLGSKEITDNWVLTDKPPPWFLDAPDAFGVSVIEKDVSAGGTSQPVPVQAYQNLDVTLDSPFRTRDYRTDVYSHVISHNPTLFSQSMVPTNWKYSLTGSWITRRNGFRYTSTGSLVWWFRFGGASGSIKDTTDPGAGGIYENANSSGWSQWSWPMFTGSAPHVPTASQLHPKDVDGNSYLTTGSYFFNESSENYVYVGGHHPTSRYPDSSYEKIIGGKGIYSKPFTVAAWVYLTEYPSTYFSVILAGGTFSSYGRGLAINSQGSLILTLGGQGVSGQQIRTWNADYLSTPHVKVPLNQWTHIVATYNGQWASGSFGTDAGVNQGSWNTPYAAYNTPVEFYINGMNSIFVGKLRGNVAPGEIHPAWNYAAIGAGLNQQLNDPTPNYLFNGYISEVAMWAEALDPYQIQAISQAISGTMTVERGWRSLKSYSYASYPTQISGSVHDQAGVWWSETGNFHYNQRDQTYNNSTYNGTTYTLGNTRCVLWLRFGSVGTDATSNYKTIADHGGEGHNARWRVAGATNTTVNETPNPYIGLMGRSGKFNQTSEHLVVCTFNPMNGNGAAPTGFYRWDNYLGNWGSDLSQRGNADPVEYRGVSPERPASMAFWIKVDSTIHNASSQSDYCVLNFGSGTGAAEFLRVNVYYKSSNNSYGFSVARVFGSGKAYFGRWENCYSPDEWVHVVITQRKQMWAKYYPGSSGGSSPGDQMPWYLYINGAEVEASYVSAPNWMSDDAAEEGTAGAEGDPPFGQIDDKLIIGNTADDTNTTNMFKGYITELAMWNYELNRDQIKALYFLGESGATKYYQGGTIFESDNSPAPDPMIAAIEMFNSASYRDSTDPLEQTANHGFYFGKKAGSITWGDI